MKSSAAAVTRQDLMTGFAALGLHAGSRIMVHSSLRAFGWVDGGPEAVVDALKTTVTAAGIILMPSFNHGKPFEDGGPGYFDPTETPTTNGAIPDFFWRQPNTYRSLNPTHAFAAWGVGARELVRSHHTVTTMGPGSPLHTLWKEGGRVLLLGVGFESNTFHHVVEMTTGAPCLGVGTEEYPVRQPDGTMQPVRTWGWREGRCPITDGLRYTNAFRATGLVSEHKIGGAGCLSFPMTTCYEVVSRLLDKGISGYPGCSGCPIRPRRVTWTVELT